MQIIKEYLQFTILETEAIEVALNKISANKQRIVFVLSDSGVLVGSFSDGDFRRWLLKTNGVDLTVPVAQAMNHVVRSCRLDQARTKMHQMFGQGVDLIPLVDASSRLISVAISSGLGFQIGRHYISKEAPAYVIAEIGNNHNGDYGLAKHLIDKAIAARADCVKFQMRDMNSIYGTNRKSPVDLGTEYTLDLLSKTQLTTAELFDVFTYAQSQGITPLCTPWDEVSLSALEEYGLEAYKVASADLTNYPLLEKIVNTGKPMFCSTGMATDSEIREAAKFLDMLGAQYVLLHCNSTYPAPFKDINLKYLDTLKSVSGGLVGYSGHERGIAVATAAVALGAKVVEKHFTIDRNMEGVDHKVSLLPDEFELMVSNIRQVEESLGSDAPRSLSQGEKLNRENLGKSLVAAREIASGEIFTRSCFSIKSPGQGLQPSRIDELIGKKAVRAISAGEYIFESDLLGKKITARAFKFDRPFGIPVRYHDFKQLLSMSNLDLVEFHMSYGDLDLDPSNYLEGAYDCGFAVHSPELFERDHVLDLSSKDSDYRFTSVSHLNRVCNATRELKAFFPRVERPKIIVNAGGFSEKTFINRDETPAMYERVVDSIAQVDQSGIEIIIQTMPPFPWHFGGQRFHNLFVSATHLSEFCSQANMRICLDISHSMMACNHNGWDLSEFIEEVAPFVAHLHISDARGVDGEGVEIGFGDIDFKKLMATLDGMIPDVSFVPEIWQGHKNSGEGFWAALEFLESATRG